MPGCALNVYGPRNDVATQASTTDRSAARASSSTAVINPRETAFAGSTGDSPTMPSLAAANNESSPFDRRLLDRPLADRPIAQRHPVARLTGHESMMIEQPPALLSPRVPLFPVPTRPVFGPAGIESHPSSPPPEPFRMAPPMMRPPQQPETIVPGVEAKAPAKADSVAADLEPRPISEPISVTRIAQSVLVRGNARATRGAEVESQSAISGMELQREATAETPASTTASQQHHDSQPIDAAPTRRNTSTDWKSQRASDSEDRVINLDRTTGAGGPSDVRTASASTASTSNAMSAKSAALNWR